MLSASRLQISSRFVTVCPFTTRQLRSFPTTQEVGRPAHYLFIYREIPCRSIAGWCRISMKCDDSWNRTLVYMYWPQQMPCFSCKMAKEGRGGHDVYTSITIEIVEKQSASVRALAAAPQSTSESEISDRTTSCSGAPMGKISATLLRSTSGRTPSRKELLVPPPPTLTSPWRRERVPDGLRGGGRALALPN